MALKGLSWVALTGALALSALAIILGVIRWQAVLRTMGFHLPFYDGLRATLEVWPLVVVAPSRSNELLRAASVRNHVPFWAGAGSVLAEKVIDLHTLLWLGAIGVALQGLTTWCLCLLAVIAAGWLGGGLVWRTGGRILTVRALRRFESKLAQVADAFRAIARNPGRAVLLTLISVVVRTVTIGILAVLLWGLGAGVTPWVTLCLAPSAFLVGLLPFSLTGIGLRDAAFLVLVGQAGHSVHASAPIVAATLGYSLISTWLFALLSLPMMIKAGIRAGKRDPGAQSTEEVRGAAGP